MSATIDCTVLCICTGNICRSPAAERLLAARLGPTVRVSSAGTRAIVGWSIAGPMVARLRQAGLPTVRFAARQLQASMVAEADLVLAMSRGHRAEAVRLAPETAERSFTLLEFGRLIELLRPEDLPGDTPGERLRSAVPVVDRMRRAVRGRDDIADPFGGSSRAYQRAYVEIDRAVTAICVAVGAAVPTPEITWD